MDEEVEVRLDPAVPEVHEQRRAGEQGRTPWRRTRSCRWLGEVPGRAMPQGDPDGQQLEQDVERGRSAGDREDGQPGHVRPQQDEHARMPPRPERVRERPAAGHGAEAARPPCACHRPDIRKVQPESGLGDRRRERDRMAYVVSAKWRAKEGKEERLLAVIREMTPPSRAEAGQPLLPGAGARSRTRGSSSSTSSTRTRPPTRPTWTPEHFTRLGEGGGDPRAAPGPRARVLRDDRRPRRRPGVTPQTRRRALSRGADPAPAGSASARCRPRLSTRTRSATRSVRRRGDRPPRLPRRHPQLAAPRARALLARVRTPVGDDARPQPEPGARCVASPRRGRSPPHVSEQRTRNGEGPPAAERSDREPRGDGQGRRAAPPCRAARTGFSRRGQSAPTAGVGVGDEGAGGSGVPGGVRRRRLDAGDELAVGVHGVQSVRRHGVQAAAPHATTSAACGRRRGSSPRRGRRRCRPRQGRRPARRRRRGPPGGSRPESP